MSNPTTPPSTGTFSILRGLLHAGAATLGTMLLGSLMAGLDLFASSEKAAETMGRELVWVTVLAFLASFGAQTGKRLLFYGALAGTLIFAVAIPVVLALAGTRARSQRLTDAERADFLVANRRLCNLALGVSLADPGETFHSEPEMQKLMNEGLRKIGDNLAGWVWKADSGEVLMIQAAKGAASSPRAFTDFIGGVRKSLTSEKDLQTADFPELSSLLGKKFGGDGVRTFALPDYRNRIQARLGSESLAYYIAVEAVEGAVPREGHVPWREREIGQIALLAFELKDWGPSWLPVDGRSIASTELLYDLLPNGIPNLAGSAPAGSHYAMVREGIYPSGSRVEMLSGVLTGEIRLFPDYRNDFKPAGWIECDGSKMAVKQHTLLSSYLGERFGGRYPVFELPDLTDSAPAGHRYCLCLKGMYPIRP